MGWHSKVQPSSRLQIEVDTEATSVSILNAAFTKQSTFNLHLMVSRDKREYELLLPSRQPTNYVPWRTAAFMVHKYKEAAGLPYSSLKLILNWKGICRNTTQSYPMLCVHLTWKLFLQCRMRMKMCQT